MMLALDLGGTKLRALLLSEELLPIARKEVLTQAKKGKKSVLRKIVSLVKEIIVPEVKIITVASSGITNEEGEFVFCTNLPLMGVNLKRVLEGHFKRRVMIENDARCFALAEAHLGVAQGFKSIVGLALGTGIGGAIISDGKLFKGAAEIGHMILNPSGPKDVLGHRGDFEAYCSGVNLLRRGKVKDIKELGAKEVKEMYFYLGIGLANIVNILSPEVIVLGGSLASFLDTKKVEQEMRKHTIPVLGKETKVLKGELKENAALFGAALRVLNHNL